MNNDEYIKIKEHAKEIFSDDSHKSRVREIMKNSWDNIRNFPYRDFDDIKKWQLERISYLVDYAYKNIPLYKKKYDAVGYKVGSIKTWDDYDKLPILYKEELIAGFPNEIVKEIDDFNLSTRSSGSSGKFLTLAVSLDAIYNDTIQGYRQYYLQSGNKYTKEDMVLYIYTCPWWIENLDSEYQTSFLPTTTPVDDAVKYIKQIRPSIISTYPTYLNKLSMTGIKLSDYGVKVVIVHSEQSNAMQRDMLSKALGVPVLDEYSSEELTRIALECPNHTYHLEEDACYIEIINPETLKRCDYGKEGVVVGTNLLNTATPIIKYWQGDLAVIDEPIDCECHNNCRVLKEIKGRYMDSIKTPTGEIIPASAFMDIAYNWFLVFNIPIHGLRYQFVQENTRELNLYLIKGLFDIDLEKIKESVYLLIPKTMKLNIMIVNEFPITIGNKYRPVISKI
nr:phenylacetate--CoA ligase family protein [Bacilli bacterium]